MKASRNVIVKTLLLALFVFLTENVMAQTTTVTGTVFDSAGETVIGASVVEKGKTAGVNTDIDGNFSIKVTNPDATLVFSYIGMTPQEVPLNGQKHIEVTLKEDNVALNEVVVVGYGTMKKSDLAGASVSMGEDDLKGSIITNIDQSLQGRAAGVSAVQTSGAPGSSSSIRVRGQATINANAEPLYVIDGVIMQGGGNSGADFGLGSSLGNGKVSTVSPLSTINPNDIVSMEILKDASATAIYGAQGANGVVLITTKRGKVGEAKFTYEGMVAMSRQTKRLDMMNLREYATYYNDFVTNGFISQPSDTYADPSLLGVGTNWQDAIFRTAWQNSHQISAQGGTDKVQYYVSGSFMDQEGTVIGSDFKRFSVRANLDAQLKWWLKLGVSSSFTNTDENIKLADGEQGVIYYSLSTLPDIPIYDIDGNYATMIREGYTNPNPVALAMSDDIKLKRKKLAGNIFFDVNPLKGLTWHAEFDYDVSSSQGETYKPLIDLGGWVRNENESSIQKNDNWYWALKNYVSYNGQYDLLSYSAMIGQECWESSWDYTKVAANGLPSDAVHNPALGTTSSFKIGAGFGSSSMASFFTRETLNWDDRYLLTYTYRYDGSSNFGPKNRWAGFNSVAGAWRFSNEKFMRNTGTWLSNGKLRLGWGQTGNSNIGGYAWGASINRMPTALGMGYRPGNLPNTGIKWETQEQWNAGLDLGFFNNRLNLTADAYIKSSKDMLMSMQLPTYMGTSGNVSSALAAPKGNYGEIENKGLEIEVRAIPVQTKDFEWESTFQISFNKNKLKSLSGTENANLVGYGQWDDVVSVSSIGEPLYNFYGYVVEGIYQDYDDIMNSPKSDYFPSDGVFNRYNTVWPGDIKFKDVNGDGKIDVNDRTVIGSPMPDFTLGWTNTLHYKNFDLSLFLQGSYGNDVLNYLAINLTNMKSTWTNQVNTVNDHAVLAPIDPNKEYASGAWYDDVLNVRVQNSETKVPRAAINDPNDNDRLSTRYIEDGSYLRFKNISLGYTFPKSVTKKLYLENLRLYANIQNLWTITKYKGYDPEIGASTQDSSGLVFGLDFGRYPSPTTYSLGLNISF